VNVVELVIYGLAALWGPPLLFAAYLLRPIKSAASRSRQWNSTGRPSQNGRRPGRLPGFSLQY